jgi:hypothetical protein
MNRSCADASVARSSERHRLVVEVVESAASPSCPSCGAECSAVPVRCRSCGLALIEDAGGRAGGRVERTQRPVGSGSALPWVVALVAAVAAVVAVVVMLFSGGAGGSPADVERPGPPAPVPALEAERRLDLRFGDMRDDETAAVRCPYRIEPRQLVRCKLRSADGIARAMLVRLAPSGTLYVAIPYPVTMTREVGVTRRAGPPGWRPVVRRDAR